MRTDRHRLSRPGPLAGGSSHEYDTGRPGSASGSPAKLRLSDLLRRPITDRGGESIGRLSDVIVRLRGADDPVVTGLVATVGGRAGIRADRAGGQPRTGAGRGQQRCG